MASTLKRLFTYAKSENEALENFTTEALAAAIRIDPAPLVVALRFVGVAVPAGEVTVRDVQTQVGVGDAGILDLILLLRSNGEETEFWFEVKCYAAESGNQLTKYRAHIAARPRGLQPLLVVLAREPLPGHEDLPWLSWQALWRATDRKGTRTPAWQDFRRFLEEIGMANRFDSTITAHEASAQTDAFVLLHKMENVLEPVVAHVARLTPKLQWPPSRTKLRAMLTRNFRDWGNFTVACPHTYRAGMSFGAYKDDETRESWAGVRVWCSSAKDLAVRRQLVDLADTAKISDVWERAPADDEGAALVVYARLAAFNALPELSAWFTARFDELQAAGVLPAIPTLGSATVQPTDDGEEGE